MVIIRCLIKKGNWSHGGCWKSSLVLLVLPAAATPHHTWSQSCRQLLLAHISYNFDMRLYIDWNMSITHNFSSFLIFFYQPWWLWVHLRHTYAQDGSRGGESPWWLHGTQGLGCAERILQITGESLKSWVPYTTKKNKIMETCWFRWWLERWMWGPLIYHEKLCYSLCLSLLQLVTKLVIFRLIILCFNLKYLILLNSL